MTSPMDKGTVVEKINNGEVKVKRARQAKAKAQVKAKPATPATNAAKSTTAPKERPKLEFTEAQILDAVKSVGHPAVSREISDKLQIADADQGRAFVRSRMAALIKDGKIKTSEPQVKSRATFLYAVVE